MGRKIALLRGINVGGGNKVPMADLRALGEGLGWRRVETVIQSGNLLFEADGEGLDAALEAAIEAHFGLRIPVVVRSAEEWAGFIAANPFPDAAGAEPQRLMLTLSKAPLAPDAEGRLAEEALMGERVAVAAGAIWIHYAGGAWGSKLMPGYIDKAAGSPATSRNWRTASKIGELLRG
ncbi:MAG: DUF1697 domain-containing protein [Allosphingosinicella sp.]|uniref:DUF1697 domain-containing protein n=1 Tax=Allosphingosinicella sp. TaxID=2823234 RepID=UPI003923F97D